VNPRAHRHDLSFCLTGGRAHRSRVPVRLVAGREPLSSFARRLGILVNTGRDSFGGDQITVTRDGSAGAESVDARIDRSRSRIIGDGHLGVSRDVAAGMPCCGRRESITVHTCRTHARRFLPAPACSRHRGFRLRAADFPLISPPPLLP
jgi:hypothetical protein